MGVIITNLLLFIHHFFDLIHVNVHKNASGCKLQSSWYQSYTIFI